MPAYPTTLDVAKKNGSDAIVGLIDETTRVHPEMTLIAARTITGTFYRTRVRTALGRTTGSFRNTNQGTANIVHQYENRVVQSYIMNPRFIADQAIADSYEDGREAYIAEEGTGVMEGEMQGVCNQFYYGTGAGGNVKGFPGLIQSYDAGGTTANTGTSVWLIRTGVQDVRWCWGNGGQMTLSPVRVQSIDDGTGTGNMFEAYITGFIAYPGLQIGSVNSAVRIKNVTEDNGHTLNDALITKALTKFRAGMGPNLILCTKRSLAQLQQSRTATTPTGAAALFPTSYIGLDGTEIPVKVTEAISDAEPLTL